MIVSLSVRYHSVPVLCLDRTGTVLLNGITKEKQTGFGAARARSGRDSLATKVSANRIHTEDTRKERDSMNAADHAAATQMTDSNFQISMFASSCYDYLMGSDTSWPTT